MTTATRKVTQKIVHILARYAMKQNGILTGVVVYLVLSSKRNEQYTTTLVNGKATGCTCPAHKPCYHMTQLEKIEQERMMRESEEALAREQAEAVAAAEAMLTSEDEMDEEYEQWKRENGLDQPLSRGDYNDTFDPCGWELL